MYSPDVVAANVCEDNTISLPKVVNYSKSLDFVSDHAENKEKMLTEDSGADAETSTDARRPNRSGSFGKSDNESHTPSKREIEPLLQPDENRFVMFPIRHNDVWDLYKKSIDSFWKAEDLDLSKDPTDWKRLTPDVQNFIKMVLAFFAASDGVIVENLALRFMSEIQAPEIRAFYAFQNFMEGIHSEVYSLLIDTYVDDPDEKMKLFHAVEHYPCIKKKSDWARKWISDGRSSFATRLLAFAIVEGIYFSSSFAAIFWLKRMNVLPGLCLANEYISRDESMHVDHAVLLYKKLKRKVPKKRFVEIMKEAVEIEIDFITVSIPCRMIGMNHDLMIQYIKFVTDRLCLQMGYDKIYHATNPFDFMEFISLDCRTNFFERRVSAYSMANKTMDDTTFDMNTDF
jgi:ribonucleotide reductase beta subunit family protein with ferritin-like domain